MYADTWSLAEAKEHLKAWLAADLNLATSSELTVTDGLGMTKVCRADAAAVQRRIDFWRREVERLSCGSAGGPRISQVVLLRD